MIKKYKLIRVNLETMDYLVLAYYKKYKNAFKDAVALNRLSYLDKFLFKVI